MPQPTQTSDLALLDEFLDQLATETEADNDLLREHLLSARQYLVGSMPDEYKLNLKLASEALNGISDEHLRMKLELFIRQELGA